MESSARLQPSVSVWTLASGNATATILCVMFFVGWHFGVVREVPLSVVLFFTILCVTCHIAGTLILRALPVSFFRQGDYAYAFLLGYLFVNSSLFILALASPWGVKLNLAVIVAVIALGATVVRVVPSDPPGRSPLTLGTVSVVISLLAATLWAQDAIQPVTLAGAKPILTHWPDSFIHARYISMFTNQARDAPIQNLAASGEPARLYHYASYMLPAALSAFTTTPAYSILGSFMMPVGIFLTGLAAYAIGSSFWGEEAGVAATVALLLLPDAAQQGVHNFWYSYHFLQQVNPAQLFGVAIMGAAWVYMFDACRTGRAVSLCMSYVLAAICIAYKAQFFVANAFLIWVFPAIFFGTISRQKRIIWIVVCTGSYWLALKLAEGIPSVPTIDFDGRGLLRSAKWIIANFESASLREYLAQFLPQQGDSRFYSLAFIVAMSALLFVITFGVFGPIYLALAWRLRNGMVRMALLFPLFVIIVYMVMSVGLAPNVNGNTDELLHRPFAWAYFVVCAWVGGGAWLVVSKWVPQDHRRRVAIAAIPLLLFVPWTFGKAIEVGPTRLWVNFDAWWNVPGGLVKAAYYIRDHSQTTDIVQDSRGDERVILSGLTERQPYALWNASISERGPQPSTAYIRFAEITKFKSLTSHEDVIEMARRYGIRWFVVHPEDMVGWPQSVIDNAAFESDGYRVYRFVQ